MDNNNNRKNSPAGAVIRRIEQYAHIHDPAVIVLSSMYFMRSYSDATEQEVPIPSSWNW